MSKCLVHIDFILPSLIAKASKEIKVADKYSTDFMLGGSCAKGLIKIADIRKLSLVYSLTKSYLSGCFKVSGIV